MLFTRSPVKRAEWFNANGSVDQALLYELTRGEKRRSEIVLGLNVPVDPELATTLRAIAIQAGAKAASFVVRFLPVEASHRESLAKSGIAPLHQRPMP
jgi:hypothetical protein